MKLTPIESIELPQIQIYRFLRDNKTTQDNSFIADSPKVVNELLKSDIEVRSILATQKYYEANKELIEKSFVPILYVASKELMESIVGHKVHHNVMMHGIRPAQVPMENLGDHIIMLDQLSKTENIGSIIRSAVALEVDALVTPTYPHPYGRRALRVSMGHIAKLPIHTYDNIISTILALKEQGYRIYGAEVTPEATALSQLTVAHRWVLLMGHEQTGISPEVLEHCDEVISIEMNPEIKSFNVSVAASIILYQLSHKKVISL